MVNIRLKYGQCPFCLQDGRGEIANERLKWPCCQLAAGQGVTLRDTDCQSSAVQRLSQLLTVLCHCTLLCGLANQWVSTGKRRNWLGMPWRCRAVNAASPSDSGMR